METTLIVSQITFYFVVSLAVIVIGIFFSIVIYHFICITRDIKKITRSLSDLSSDAQEKISEIIESLSKLPIFSFLFKKKRTRVRKDKKEKV